MGSVAPPELVRLPANAPFADVVDTLLSDGGIIVSNFITQPHVQSMLEILNTKFPENHDFAYETPGSFFPQETKVLWSLAARGDPVGKDICFHPLLVNLRQELLHMSTKRGNDYGSQGMQTSTAEIPPRLSLSVAFDMRPGAKSQPLHRDEDVWGTTHELPFSRGRIRQIGVLVAGTRSVRENGATLVIPGSHKWDDDRMPREEEACFAEMEEGDALIFLSGTRHAGGAITVSPFLDDGTPNPLARRVMFSYFFARGYLRQEENMLVSIPRDVVLKMDPEMQRLIGYDASSSHCGFVEFKSPMDIGLKRLFSRSGDEF